MTQIKRNYKLVYLGIIAMAIFFSCSKKEDISEIPSISFESVSPFGNIRQYEDSILFKISYRDGDGDLGENIDSVNNLFLTDSRNNVTYKYRLQELAPMGAKIPIQGSVNILLTSISLVDPASSSETTTFSIYLVDRAGNKSNTVTSSVLTIVP
ncbi:MAG: hypothetical protein K1X82_02835 [Bacteroidia bacterium]|nr:hypothetical protein [Bacteroidia bacterium]